MLVHSLLNHTHKRQLQARALTALAQCVSGWRAAGMLCTASSAREMGLDASDIPIHVYGPPGLAAFIG